MKFKKIGLSIAVISALVLGFTGCGSSSTETPAATTETGTFVDAPVQGLKYTTATQSGYTNDKGEFKYVAGETVEFKLGNLSLGAKIGSALMTPYTLGDSNTTNPSAKTINIAMLLQSFDGDRSNGNILDLSKLKDYNFTGVNLSATTDDMTIKLNDILTTGNFANDFADGNTTSINATTVNSALKTYVLDSSFKLDKKFTQAYLNGKTFYIPTSWAEKGDQGEKTIVKITFTDNKISFYGYDNDPEDTNKDYNIVNGTINIPYVEGVITATSVDKEGIFISSFGTYGKATKMFFDKTKAEAKLTELQN
jgi:hypothetical protein